jgi:PAS domain-containing protein
MTNRGDIVPIDSDRRHQAVLDRIGDGVIATDSDDNIVFLNPFAQRNQQIARARLR